MWCLRSLRIAFAALLVLGVACGGMARASSARAASPRTGYEVVRSAAVFATGGIGEGFETPPETLACRRLRDKPMALLIFLSIEAHGTNEGKAYALWMLRDLSPPLFEVMIDRYRGGGHAVHYMSGCLGFDVDMYDLFTRKDMGFR